MHVNHKSNKLLGNIARYYSTKLAEHGETPNGVDWNGEEGQVMRFAQICKLIATHSSFSLNDLGCGYGAMFEYLASSGRSIKYYGYDISADMVAAAEARFTDDPRACFFVASEPTETADFGVASGIFNVRLDHNDDEWLEYLKGTLDALDRTSTKGFAFNCLTSYSDADKMRDRLYYADPCMLFDLCKRRYSRNVALLHDYGLYEFTILVRKEV